MKVIVTGGAGFIGSHLCEKLLENGTEVICLDNFITGNQNNVQKLQINPAFKLLERDINNPFSKEEIGQLGKIDQIYNLACPASPVDYRDIPLQTLWVCAAGTKNMLELAVKNGAAFLQVSTSEVYGDPEVHPQKEDYWGNCNPLGERSCYNEGKRFAESLAMNYYHKYKFPLTIVRVFNTYGSRMRKNDGRVIPEFINNALAGEPLLVTGSGKQTRSFCYITDMIEGLLSAMRHAGPFTGAINIGNPDEINIMDLAKLIKTMTKSNSLIQFVPAAADDPARRKPDITLARKLFSFEPKIVLEEGLKRTIDYFTRNS